jgi:hypothetical protein
MAFARDGVKPPFTPPVRVRGAVVARGLSAGEQQPGGIRGPLPSPGQDLRGDGAWRWGLIVQLNMNAQQDSLSRLAQEVSDLSREARSDPLKTEEVPGGTFPPTSHSLSGPLRAPWIINLPSVLSWGLAPSRSG